MKWFLPLPARLVLHCSGAPRRKLFGSSRAIAYLIEEGHPTLTLSPTHSLTSRGTQHYQPSAASNQATRSSGTEVSRLLTQCCSLLLCVRRVVSGFLALIAFEEADAQLRGLPSPSPPPSLAPSSGNTVSPAMDALEAERSRLLAVRHHCMVALLDQLDVLSLPPLSFPPDIAFLRSHLLHMLYSVGKGRLLLLRCLMRLPPPHTFDIVSILAANLTSTCTPAAASRVDEQFAVLAADILYAAPMHTANVAYSHFIQPSTQPSALVSAVKSKMGCMFLQVIAKKGQDMRLHYDTSATQQSQSQTQPSNGQEGAVAELSSASPAAISLSGSILSPPRLSSVSADFAVWASLTGELLRLLSGQWAAVFSDLPNTANTVAAKPSSASAAASSPLPSISLASARAMWDLVSLLLSHITASASHAPADDESVQAKRQLDGLIVELRPLMRQYLTVTYQLDSSSAERLEPAASIAAPFVPSATAAAVVVAAAASAELISAPRLLPLPHSSLLYACSVLLAEDDTALSDAQTAHKRSEEKVRAFIAAKQQRLSQHYNTRQRAPYNVHLQRQGPPAHSARGVSTRSGSSQPHSGFKAYPQQSRAGLPHTSLQQHNNDAIAPGVQQLAVSKSQPGSYAFAAASKA